MTKLTPVIFFLICSVLYAEEPIPLYSKEPIFDSNKNFFLMAKNTEENFESEDEDEEEVSASTVGNKTNKTTKGSNRPSTPNSSSDLKSVGSDMDPAKKKQLTDQGLSALRVLEERNNASSVRQIGRHLLTNPIPEVRAEAARILGKMGKGMKYLHRAIDTDGYEVRQEAYKSIERIGSRASLRYFIKGTQSTDSEIRMASFKGLGKTRSSIGRDMILRNGIPSPEPGIVSASLIGLGYYSRREDIVVFKKFLGSEVTDHQAGAIQGLGVSKISGTIELLLMALEKNPSMEPEVIHAISQKKTLAGTLTLIKLLHSSKNENYQGIIQKELYSRKAYGSYALVKTNTATMRRYSRANANKVGLLHKGDVARIRKVTSKLFKAKMNNDVIEDRYYLLQGVNDKENSKRQIIEGWVFGPKLTVITLSNPAKSSKPAKANSKVSDETEELMDEDSEDEAGIVSSKESPPSAKNEKEEPEFYDEDEDE